MSEQEMSEQEDRSEQSQSQSSLVSCLLLLLVLLVVASAILISRGGPGGAGFAPAPLAWSFATETQAYRKANPSARNYCIIALKIEDTKGAITDGPSLLLYGFGQTNVNHCEQRALRWMSGIGLPATLNTLDLSRVSALHMVLFTQVRTCDPCMATFSSWEQQLRQQVAAKKGGSSVHVNLYDWEITPNSPSGFDPGKYRAGPYTAGGAKPGSHKPVPVRQQDLDQVYP